MKRGLGIAALAVTAAPATLLIGAIFVAIIESWKWPPPPGDVRLLGQLSPSESVIAGAVAVGIAAVWWGGWAWLLKAAPGPVRQSERTLPRTNLGLMIWFVALLLFATYRASQQGTW